MNRLLLIVLAASMTGCAMYKDLTMDRSSKEAAHQETYEEEAARRVVYTPLLNSRPATDPKGMEVLLRAPAREYRELGLISMYREYRNEQAADLLRFMRARAAKEGADAILLAEIEDKQVGTRTRMGATALTNDTVIGSASTEAIREGTIRGIAIVYEGKE